MKNLLPLLLLPSLAFAQFKNDNIRYKTISWETFCKQYPLQKDALLLDVRSEGEYDDSSNSSNLNIGHLKGSTHINVTDLGAHIREIKNYKNKPVFIYCSHSQRSRRSAAMLADSGFTNIFNINGGLTDMYLTDANFAPCKNEMLQTKNAYTQLNPMEVYQMLKLMPATTIVDVRPDSVFNRTTRNAKLNALGKFKGSINIPIREFENAYAKIYKFKPVLVVDADGNEASRAATFLATKGYEHVSICFNGLDEWLQLGGLQKKWTNELIERKIDYQTLDAVDFNSLATKEKVIVVDIRPQDEFENKSTENWRNRGHIKDALNIPIRKLKTGYPMLSQDKSIVIYGFANDDEIYEAASFLASKGYKKVYVLTPGIWGLRYKAFNAPNCMYLNDWVVAVPEENR